jgi:hypothetical protein
VAEPGLIDIFGGSASNTSTYQTAGIVQFDKTGTGLESVGLSPSASNTAESILVALILKAKEQLTQTNFDNNIEQQVIITERSRDTIQRNGLTWSRINLNVALHLLVDNTTIDPDDY